MKFTICTKANQRVHGVRNWDELFVLCKKYTVIRAREGKKLLGQIAVEIDEKNNAWIFFLAVDPDERGNGIGTQLIDKAEIFVEKSGIESIYLRPQKEFEKRLVPWYESLGYEKLERDPTCRDEWLMCKNI